MPIKMIGVAIIMMAAWWPWESPGSLARGPPGYRRRHCFQKAFRCGWLGKVEIERRVLCSSNVFRHSDCRPPPGAILQIGGSVTGGSLVCGGR